MLMVLINIVIVIVVGAILFYLIDKYVRDGRLGNLLKILVALICLAASHDPTHASGRVTLTQPE